MLCMCGFYAEVMRFYTLQLSSYHLNLLCFWLKKRLRKTHISVEFITLNFWYC